MKIVTPAVEGVVGLLGKAKKADSYRLMNYVVTEKVDEGIILFHTLTREMLLLSKDEYDHLYDLPELYEKWYIVPEDTEDKKLVDQIRFTLRALNKDKNYIYKYTIFTTTDCNARCYYCYESGSKIQSMSEETALKVVEFIAKHCGDKTVSINWFGGEPLYNDKVIDIITKGLKDNNINYYSDMITNGYLLNDEIVKKAKELWKLREVQITLDGTEKIYNETKAYIYDDANPFETVISNIERCLNNQISVVIRLNVTTVNSEDLAELLHRLYERFGGNRYFKVYTAMLFEIAKREDEVYDTTLDKLKQLDKLIDKYGFQTKNLLSQKYKLNQCKADDDSSITVLPSGNLGKCEHYIDTDFIGSVQTDTIDEAAKNTFKEQYPLVERCSTCFNYPECFQLKKCEGSLYCSDERYEEKLLTIKKKIKETFYYKIGKELES